MCQEEQRITALEILKRYNFLKGDQWFKEQRIWLASNQWPLIGKVTLNGGMVGYGIRVE